MKRSWNGWLWAGFVLVLAGLFTYLPLFMRFPITRDFPWANLLLMAGGLVLLGIGLFRAFGKPQLYRGRIFGTVMAVLGTVGVAVFCWGLVFRARQLPASASAPQVGQKAPEFTLSDQDGKPVSLAGLLSLPTTIESSPARGNWALLIFYRGYW